MGNKKRKLMIIAVVLILGITTTVFAMPKITAIIQRMSMSESEQAIFDDLAKMTTEEIIDEMNTILEAGYEDDDVMLHAITIAQRIDDMSAEYILGVATDKSNHSTVRYTFLQLYADKMGSNANVSKLTEVILDETESVEVRTNAVYALPEGNVSVEKFLAGTFFTVENQEVAYHVLNFLSVTDSMLTENVADKVIADYNNYSIEQFCSAILAKGKFLRENVGNLSTNELLTEKESFTDKCISIHETYNLKTSTSSENKVVIEDWKNPKLVSIAALADLRCEKAVRYIFGEFEEKNILGADTTKTYCMLTAMDNVEPLVKLAETSQKAEDIELLLNVTEYIAYSEIVTPLKESLAEKSEYSIKYPSGFDGEYAEIIESNDYIYSWR